MSDFEALNPFRGTDLWRLREGLVLLDRLRMAGLDGGELEWHLPPDLLLGVTQAYGLPVRRVEGLPGPTLALRFDDSE